MKTMEYYGELWQWLTVEYCQNPPPRNENYGSIENCTVLYRLHIGAMVLLMHM